MSFTRHAYPQDLARLVRKRWETLDHGADASGRALLPEPDVLERLLSVCYQASLLYEEGRPVTFRVAFAQPDHFDASRGPPESLDRLVLRPSRPFDEHELRRLARAAVFERSLIGVGAEAGELVVWGLVHSGPRWLRASRGGRRIAPDVASLLTVAVVGPGRVLVSKGTHVLAALAAGTIADVATDVFSAPWLGTLFDGFHEAQRAASAAAPEQSTLAGSLDPSFGRRLVEHLLRRIVATIRAGRHGGTLVFLPSRAASAVATGARHFALKYPLADEEPRRRIFRLAVDIMRHLTSTHPGASVGWREYEATADARLAALDEGLFEVAHLVANLADIDGAVILTDQFEILGFGAEISGALPDVETVQRSLDLEGLARIRERTDRVGTRHRSAYRLCQALPEALAIVVSQDGGVRFVRAQDEEVTYFDQIATAPWEV
jgi:hypothetical protein